MLVLVFRVRFGFVVSVPEQPDRLLVSTDGTSMYQLCSSSNLLVQNDVIGASMFSLSAYESVRVFGRFGSIEREPID